MSEPATAISPLALTIAEFCRSAKISRSLFYELHQRGEGPKAFKLGRKTLISTAAAAEWIQHIESANSLTTH